MLTSLVWHARHFGHHLVRTLRQRLAAATKPTSRTLFRETLADLPRSKPQLIAENALLRQQLYALPSSTPRRCPLIVVRAVAPWR